MNIDRYFAVTAIQADFLLATLNLKKHVLSAFGASDLQKVHGASCWWIVRSHSLLKLLLLPKKGGNKTSPAGKA
jgi:hypothetical protein